MIKALVSIAILLQLASFIAGHGKMMDPVNRASLWRVDPTAPPNWTDNELSCGGIGIQHGSNKGKCGICGDNYAFATPRPHELGGKYGSGKIVAEYGSGSNIKVKIDISANHKGYFEFDLCNLDQAGAETEGCFNTKVLTVDGKDKWDLPLGSKIFEVDLKLPAQKCEHCVLRWTYTAGNNAGGPQEQFKNCADVAIV